MKDFISFPPYHIEEIAGLTFAVCKQLQIPCGDMQELGAINRLRDKINTITAKYKLNISANNDLAIIGETINQAALTLVSNGILDSYSLRKDLDEFLLKYPPLRI